MSREYLDLLDAEIAWMDEVHKLPGRPGDVRYTKAAQGEPGTKLAETHQAFLDAEKAFWAVPAMTNEPIPVHASGEFCLWPNDKGR